MITVQRYDRFIREASYELGADGGRSLVPAERVGTLPPWAAAWSDVILMDTPGAPSIVAFTRGDGTTTDELQTRVDRLVAGLADAGVFRGSPIGLHVVTVFADSPSALTAKHAGKLVPAAFIPGLRPHSYVADLTGGTLTGRGSEVIRATLQRALRAEGEPARDIAQFEARRLASRERVSSFYALMQGRRPYATYALVATNVLVFALTVWSGGSTEVSTVLHGGPVSDGTVRTWGALSPILMEHGQWWRVVSEMFLHGSLTHILFNMASLLAVGTLAERLYGSSKFLAIYFGAGIIGSLASFTYAVWGGNTDMLAVGASGAIFGVAGALLTVRFQDSDVIPANVRRGISSSMLPLVAISLFLAAATQYVDNSAHVGGLLGGILLSFVFSLSGARSPILARPAKGTQ